MNKQYKLFLYKFRYKGIEIHKILPGTYNQLLIEITQTLNILQNGGEDK